MTASFAAAMARANDSVVARVSDTTVIFADPIDLIDRPVDGVFNALYVSPFDAVSSGSPDFFCRSADLGNAGYGTTCTIGGVTYKVVKLAPDGTGMTHVKLERQP